MRNECTLILTCFSLPRYTDKTLGHTACRANSVLELLAKLFEMALILHICITSLFLSP